MAAKYDGPLDKHTDFTHAGPNGEPASGLAVQNYIKGIDSKKAGIGYTLPDGTAHLLFADTEDRDSYLNDPTQTQLIVDTIPLEPLYNMTITVLSGLYVPVFLGSTGNYLRATFLTRNKFGETVNEDVTVQYVISRGTSRQTVTQIYNPGITAVFNVDQYLLEGANLISITATGNTTGATFTTVVTYQVINLTFTDNVNIATVYDINQTPNLSIAIPYAVSGTGQKIMEWYLDGVQLEYVQNEDEINETSSERTKYISLSGLSQGVHTLQYRVGLHLNGGVFYSKTLYREVIVSTGNTSGAAVVAVAIELPVGTIVGANDTLEISAVQYQGFDLRVAAWNPNGTYENTVVASVGGTQVASVVCTVGEEDIIPLNFTSSGDKTLTLSIGLVSREIDIDVADTTMDIGEITSGLELSFSADGRTNSSVNKDSWTDGTHTATFTGFDWNETSGWQNGKLLIPSGASLSFGNYAPLASDPSEYGKTIELEFRTVNVDNDDAVLLNLIDNNGAGIKVTAHGIQVKSRGGVDLSRSFKEDEDIRISIVINMRSGVANQKLVFVYFNGINSMASGYAVSDSFISDATLSVGGTGAGILLKQIRIYNNALASAGVLNNYILYRDSTADMISLYMRNTIYEEGTSNFDISKIAGYLPVMIITGNIPAIENTTDKKLQIVADIQYTNLQDPTRSFVMKNAIMTGQGTSSMTYPKKNYRIYTKKSDQTVVYDYEGNVIQNKLYSFKEGAQPVSCWCLKTDFAESSGTHNTGVARMWNDVIKNTQVSGNYVLRTTAQATAIANNYPYDVRTTIDGFPIVAFYHLTEEDDLIFLGKFNFNNDKSTESVFGFCDIPNFDDTHVQCFEFLDSGNPLALFQTVEGFDSNWSEAWESRYPDTKTPNLTPLKTLATWITSTMNDLQKWIDEKSQHFDLYKLASYYVYLMRFGAVDQTVKNSMITTEDGVHWFFILYDNDTIMGVRNDGLLRYDPDIDRQSIDSEIGGYAYAGHGSTLWNNFEADPECMALAKQIDSALYSAGLTYANAINMFNNLQAGKWSEAIYNQDAQYKYIGPYVNQSLDYLGSLQGSRADHRKWWLSSRFALYDAKFVSGAYEGKAITLLIPGAQQNTTFSIVSGKDFYYGYGENNLVLASGVYVESGDTHTFTLSKNMEIGSPLRIYAPYYIQELDLSNFITYIGATNFNLSAANDEVLGSKLRVLILGVSNSSTDSRRNTALANLSGIANLVALEQLNVAGYQALTSLDLSTLTNLTTFKAKASGLTSVTFAAGAPLATLELPGGMQSLTLRNLPSLATSGVDIEGYGANIYQIDIRNCPNISNSPSFLLTWMQHKSTANANCSVRMENINWSSITAEQLLAIGQIKVDGGTLVLRGTARLTTVTQAIIDEITEVFGPSVFQDGSEFRITAPDSLFVSGPTSILEGENAQYVAAVFSDYPGTITWSLIGSRTGVSINSSTGVVTTTETGDATSNLTVRATFHPTTGSDMTADAPLSVVKRTYPAQGDVTITGSGNLSSSSDNEFGIEYTTTGVNGNMTAAWALSGDIASYATIVSSSNTGCVVRFTGQSVIRVTGTLTLTLSKTATGDTVATATKALSYVSEYVAFDSESNPYAMAVVYGAGLCEHSDYITKTECAAITNSDLTPSGVTYSIFYSNAGFRANCKQFDEFKYFTGLTTIPNNCFRECALENITFPSTITSTGVACFRDCQLISVGLNNGLATIGEQTFYNCYYLESVTFPSTLTTIGSLAFGSCIALTSINIPAYVSSIATGGDSSFMSCRGLTSITVDSSNQTYYSGIYNCIIRLSDMNLIFGCSSTIVPNGVTTIGSRAFNGMRGLTSISLPESVTIVGQYAFNGCTSLASFVAYGLQQAQAYAFNGCTSLASATFPKTFTNMAEGVFNGCTSLAVIRMKPIVPPTIINNSLPGTSVVQHIYVPYRRVSNYKSASNWSTYQDVIEADPESMTDLQFGNLYVSKANLYYNGTSFEVKDTDWNHDSYNDKYGMVAGSYYFNWNQCENVNLDGWHTPSVDEFKMLLGGIVGTTYIRPGSTVNGYSNVGFARLIISDVSHGGLQQASVILVFPYNLTITGTSLDYYNNKEGFTTITNAQLNEYIAQGCIVVPCSGCYHNGWNSGQNGGYWTSTEVDTNDAKFYGYFYLSDYSADKSSYYCPVRLVKTVPPQKSIFGNVNIAQAPLYYGSNGFEIKDSDWNHGSYGSVRGKNEGSYYFTFIELGSYFDSDGDNFNVNSGNIDNNNTITYDGKDDWRLPTVDELRFLINATGYTRPGSTVNGNDNKHYAMIRLTGVTFANNSTPSGLLLFPDGKAIRGTALSNLDNATLNTGITNDQLNEYLEQGCVFFPCWGDYYQRWENGGTSGSQLSATQYDSTRAVRLSFTSGTVQVGGTSTSKTVNWMVRLVRLSDE